ncbi:MAG: glutamate 5-kinase, partial [Burkholderiales bacterium]|nr:glutamate 5-kinase [Burkholderiales bacterium]
MSLASEYSEIWKKAKRIVVKVGSSLVTNEGKGVDNEAISRWVDQVIYIQHQGKQVIWVSSGAITEGIVRLKLSERPTSINDLQACAAVGQMYLAEAYSKGFQAHEKLCAQLLLTHADFANRERYLNARHTIMALLKRDVVPVINENDTVITDEIKVGDNDTLGALTTNLIDADILIILTDQEGMYTADPRNNPDAELISRAA